jgi:hypothetical protein
MKHSTTWRDPEGAASGGSGEQDNGRARGPPYQGRQRGRFRRRWGGGATSSSTWATTTPRRPAASAPSDSVVTVSGCTIDPGLATCGPIRTRPRSPSPAPSRATPARVDTGRGAQPPGRPLPGPTAGGRFSEPRRRSLTGLLRRAAFPARITHSVHSRGFLSPHRSRLLPWPASSSPPGGLVPCQVTIVG